MDVEDKQPEEKEIPSIVPTRAPQAIYIPPARLPCNSSFVPPNARPNAMVLIDHWKEEIASCSTATYRSRATALQHRQANQRGCPARFGASESNWFPVSGTKNASMGSLADLGSETQEAFFQLWYCRCRLVWPVWVVYCEVCRVDVQGIYSSAVPHAMYIFLEPIDYGHGIRRH